MIVSAAWVKKIFGIAVGVGMGVGLSMPQADIVKPNITMEAKHISKWECFFIIHSPSYND